MVAVSSCRESTPAHVHMSPQPATRVQSLSHAAFFDLAASFAFRSAEGPAHERGEQKAKGNRQSFSKIWEGIVSRQRYAIQEKQQGEEQANARI